MGFQSLCSLLRYSHLRWSSREEELPQVWTAPNKKSTSLLLVKNPTPPNQKLSTGILSPWVLMWLLQSHAECAPSEDQSSHRQKQCSLFLFNIHTDKQGMTKDDSPKQNKHAIPSPSKNLLTDFYQAWYEVCCSPTFKYSPQIGKILEASRSWEL